MVRKFILFLFCAMSVFASTSSLESNFWGNGVSLLGFFEKEGLPLNLYYNLQKEDKELATEIRSGVKYQVLRDDNNKISQVLIPINDELQIHIYKNKLHLYELDFIPIDYEIKDEVLSFDLESSPYNQILKLTGNRGLAGAFTGAFKGQINFKSLKKNDKIVIIYSQKYRMGKLFGAPNIKAALIKIGNNYEYSYEFEDKYYDEKGNELDNFFLLRPIGKARVSSPFTKKRFHPILKRYRAHLGIDYAAPTGTAIKAAGNGTVLFAGRKGGYGKAVIIKHDNTYRTIYAHASRIASGIKKGKKVKQGRVIAYVGSTGISTGPHLHFGLYKNNVAINPNSVVRIKRGKLSGKQKTKFNEIKKSVEGDFAKALNDNYINSPKYESFEDITYL